MFWKSSKNNFKPKEGKISFLNNSGLTNLKQFFSKHKILVTSIGVGGFVLLVVSIAIVNQNQDKKQVSANFLDPSQSGFNWCADGKFKVESVGEATWDEASTPVGNFRNSTNAFVDIGSKNNFSQSSENNVEVIVRCESLPSFPDMAGRWKINLQPNMFYREQIKDYDYNSDGYDYFNENFYRSSDKQYIDTRDISELFDTKKFDVVSTELISSSPKYGTVETVDKVDNLIKNVETSADLKNQNPYGSIYTPTLNPYDNLVSPYVDVLHYTINNGTQQKLFEYDKTTGIDGNGKVDLVPVTFRVLYSNTGEKNVANAKLKIQLDLNLEYSSINPCTLLTGQAQGKSCVIDGKLMTLDLGVLNVGESGVVEYSAQISAGYTLGKTQVSNVWLEGSDSLNPINLIKETQESAKILMYSNERYSVDIQNWLQDGEGNLRSNVNFIPGNNNYKMLTIYRNTGTDVIDFASEDEYNSTTRLYTDTNGNGLRDYSYGEIYINSEYNSSVGDNYLIINNESCVLEGHAAGSAGSVQNTQCSRPFGDFRLKFNTQLGSGQGGSVSIAVSAPVATNYTFRNPAKFYYEKREGALNLNSWQLLQLVNLNLEADKISLVDKNQANRILKNNLQFAKVKANQFINGTEKSVTAAPNQPLNLNIDFKNSGDYKLNSVKIEQKLSDQMEYISSNPCSAFTGQAEGKTCVVNGKTITVNIGDLEIGQSGSLVVSGQLISGANKEQNLVDLNISARDSSAGLVTHKDTVSVVQVLSNPNNDYKNLLLQSAVLDNEGKPSTTVDIKPAQEYTLRLQYTNTSTNPIEGGKYIISPKSRTSDSKDPINFISYTTCDTSGFSGKAQIDVDKCSVSGSSFEFKPTTSLNSGESGTISLKFRAKQNIKDTSFYFNTYTEAFDFKIFGNDLSTPVFSSTNQSPVIIVSKDTGQDSFKLSMKVNYDLSKIEELFNITVYCQKMNLVSNLRYNNKCKTNTPKNLLVHPEYLAQKIDNTTTGNLYNGPLTFSKQQSQGFVKNIYNSCKSEDFVISSVNTPVVNSSSVLQVSSPTKLNLGNSAYFAINPDQINQSIAFRCPTSDLDDLKNGVSINFKLSDTGILTTADTENELKFGSISAPVYNPFKNEYRVTYTYNKPLNIPLPFSNSQYSDPESKENFNLELGYTFDLNNLKEKALQMMSSGEFISSSRNTGNYTGSLINTYTQSVNNQGSEFSVPVRIPTYQSGSFSSCRDNKFFVESAEAPLMNAPDIDLYTVRNRPLESRISLKDYRIDYNNENYGSVVDRFYNGITQSFIVRCEQSELSINGTELYPAIKGRYKITIPVYGNNGVNGNKTSVVSGVNFTKPRYGVATMKTGEEMLDLKYTPSEPFPGALKDTFEYNLNVVTDLRYSNLDDFYDIWNYVAVNCYRFLNESCNQSGQIDRGALVEKLDNSTTGIVYSGPDVLQYTNLKGKINVNIYDPKEANNGVECYPGKIQPFNANNDDEVVLFAGTNTSFAIDVLANDEICDYTLFYSKLSNSFKSESEIYPNSYYSNFDFRILSKTGDDFFSINDIQNGRTYSSDLNSTNPLNPITSNSLKSNIIFNVNADNTTYPRVASAVYEIGYTDLNGQKQTKTATVTVNVDIKCGGEPTIFMSKLAGESANVLQSIEAKGRILFNDQILTSTQNKKCGIPDGNIHIFSGLVGNSLKINNQRFNPLSTENLNFVTAAGNNLKFKQSDGSVVYTPKNLPSNGTNVDTFDYTITFDYTGILPTTLDPSCTIIQNNNNGTGTLRCSGTATTTFNITPSTTNLYSIGKFKGVESQAGVEVGVNADNTKYAATFTRNAFDLNNINLQDVQSATFSVDPEVNPMIQAYAQDKIMVSPLTQPTVGNVSCKRGLGVYFNCTYNIPQGSPEGDHSFKLKLTYTDPDGLIYTRIQDVNLQIIETADRTCLNGGNVAQNCTTLLQIIPPDTSSINNPDLNGGSDSQPSISPSDCGAGTLYNCTGSTSRNSPWFTYTRLNGEGGTGGDTPTACNLFSCDSDSVNTNSLTKYYAKNDAVSLSSNNTNITTNQITIPVSQLHRNDNLIFNKPEYYKMSVSKVQVTGSKGQNLGTLKFSTDQTKVVFTYNNNFASVAQNPKPTGFSLMQNTSENFLICQNETVSFDYILSNQPDTPTAKVTIDCNNRILDCRLPDSQGNLVAVSPVIVADYASVSEIGTVAGQNTDILGLTLDSEGNTYTLKAPSRSLYKGGGSIGESNNQDDLYNYTDLNIIKLTSGTGNNPENIQIIPVSGWKGRPMDIDTKGFKPDSDNTFYVFGLRKTIDSPLDQQTLNNDLNGSLEGFIALITITENTAAVTSVITGLPAAGYAKDYADIAVGKNGQIYIDDSRESIQVLTNTNDYIKIPGANSANTITFDQPNRFYDIGIDADGNAVSLYGEFNGNTINNRNSINLGKNKVKNPDNSDLILDLPWDGGDLEVANNDTTYASDFVKQTINDNGEFKFIYYTTGNGSSSSPAIIKVEPNGVQSPSNLYSVDSSFNSINTGYMDKILFSFDGSIPKQNKQVIYYKNGNRTQNSVDSTIGKIYCPSSLEEIYNPPSTPPNPGFDDKNTPPNPPVTDVDNPDPNTTTAQSTLPSETTGSTDTTSETTTGGSTLPSVTSETATNVTPPPAGTPNISAIKSARKTDGSVISANEKLTSSLELDYVITLTNSGTANATNVVITDIIDQDLIYTIGNCGANCDDSSFNTNRTIKWTIPTIASGTTTSVRIRVKVK